MKRALVLYWHGLGDVIQLTPHLRHLYKNGFLVDLMCRKEVRNSHLLDNCPYVENFISVENPWRSSLGFVKQREINIDRFNKLKQGYDWAGKSCHDGIGSKFKIDYTSKELNLIVDSRDLEVFIPPHLDRIVSKGVHEKYPDGYIFVHTYVEFHPNHTWDATGWINKNLPNLPIFYSKKFNNINEAFVIAREATHRVLSSSVFVHACDAMGCVIDIINYGTPDRKVWPLKQSKILQIREKGKLLK